MTAEAGPLLETALVSEHVALGAKMAPFNGWNMPIQYEGILAEHQHTRTAAGLFDLSHMGRLSLTGPDALALVQRVSANDASKVAVGAAHYSLLCNEQGGIIDDILVYHADAEWRLVVNAGNRERVVPHLIVTRAAMNARADVVDYTVDTALLGVQGPESLAALQPHVDYDLDSLGYYRFVDTHLVAELDGPPVSVSRSGYTGEDGFEVTIAADQAVRLWRRLLQDPRVHPIGLGARDTLRLEAGMPLYGHELNDDTTPYEAGLSRVPKLDKGDFVGRAALKALSEKPPARQLVALGLGPGAVPRQGSEVLQAGEKVGAIASGTFSPTLKRPIATAFVTPAAATLDTELTVAIRDSQVAARVVSLPFVPHHTKARKASA